MIDFKIAEEEFLKYTNRYDLKDTNIERKVGHSLRVMKISKEIATRMNLTNEQVEIATLIGLLHDIGRFEQRSKFKTFEDLTSLDHGDLAVEILEQDNYIRKFIETNKYDKIILKAIKNHNKYKIEDGLNEEELLFAKIIRDADKIDILYESIEMFWKNQEQDVNNSIIDYKVYDCYMQQNLIDRNLMLGEFNYINDILCVIAFVFDINFTVTFEILKENKYIDKIFGRFDFKDTDVKLKMEEARILANKYIEEKIKNS